MPEFKNHATSSRELTLVCFICGCHVSLLSKITPTYLIFENNSKVYNTKRLIFFIFILLSRENDGGAMHRTIPHSHRSGPYFRFFRLNFAFDFNFETSL